jgi:hypothetical protein
MASFPPVHLLLPQKTWACKISSYAQRAPGCKLIWHLDGWHSKCFGASPLASEPLEGKDL